MCLKRCVAILDADGSFIRSSLFLLIVDALVRAFPNLFSEETLASVKRAKRAWEERENASCYDDYLHTWTGEFDQGILRGLPIDGIRPLIDEVLDAHANKTYVFTRLLHSALCEVGYETYLVSLSPDFVVQAAASRWGFTRGFGMPYVVANGKFTGDRFFPDKRKIVLNECINQPGLPQVEDTIVVGDTMGDLSMLKMADRAIAFNPCDALKNAAREEGFTVVVERKDSIDVQRPTRLVEPLDDGRLRLIDVNLREVFPPDVACVLDRRLRNWREKR